jgi:hypothetical protein
MPENESPPDASPGAESKEIAPAPVPERRPLPNGYRQGIVSAVTIFIGFSLAFLRFWAFEAPGHWTPHALIVALILAVPILLEIYVLFRSLRVADDDETEYAETIRWFVISVVAMLVAIVVAAVLPH